MAYISPHRFDFEPPAECVQTLNRVIRGRPPKVKLPDKYRRNEPCPCGAMQADGKTPKKFKHCCM